MARANTDTETSGTCPVMWPVGIVRGVWVEQPCGLPTDPGQRYCTWCQEQAESERGHTR